MQISGSLRSGNSSYMVVKILHISKQTSELQIIESGVIFILLW